MPLAINRIGKKPVQPKRGEPRATQHPLYKAWRSMRQRCQDPKAHNWYMYGARGVTVCKAWDEDFWAFVADVGERPPGHTLERIKNDRGYEPGNVKWATASEQQRNTRQNHLVTWQDETLPVAVWAEREGVTFHQMWSRVRHYKDDMQKVMASIAKLKGAA